MTRLWRWIMSKLRWKSPETIEAERRLQVVYHDDAKIDLSVWRGQEIVKQNHLGPLIAQLFERPKP